MIQNVDQAKQAIVKSLDDLRPEQIAEVLDFTTFLRERKQSGDIPQQSKRIELRLVPATSLLALTGIVSLGGDALADTEALYDGNISSH